MSNALASYTDLSTIHFLTSGSDGAIKLGNTLLTADSLSGRAGEVANWHNALQSDGSLMFYGCDLAGSESGKTLLEGLAALTGDGVSAGANGKPRS